MGMAMGGGGGGGGGGRTKKHIAPLLRGRHM